MRTGTTVFLLLAPLILAIAPAEAQQKGGFGGFGSVFPLWSLRDLNPIYDGQPVVFFGQGAFFLNGFYFGGGSGSATFYGKSRTVDRADFRYGGFIAGYRHRISSIFRLAGQVMVGGGKLRIESGRLIEFDEGFFSVVPELSLGVSPSRWLLLEARMGYFEALGSQAVRPLRKPQLGLFIMLGTN